MPIPDVLRSLLTTAGPSGYETAAAAVFADASRAFTDRVEIDGVGSVTATVPGKAGGPSVVLAGHIDEIGLIVTHITDEGFIHFSGVGGWDPLVLISQRVEISTKNGRVAGVLGRKPIHLETPHDRRKQNPEIHELHIDIGAKDGDAARGLVRIGDVAVIAGDPVELQDRRIAGRSMDNRLGCYIALQAARLVAEAGGAAGDVIALAAVQEEITGTGARTTAHRLNPDAVIIVDVAHATCAPGVDERRQGKHHLGSGPVIQRGSILHPALTEALIETGGSSEIPHTLAASGDITSTDADMVHFEREGIATALVGVPVRYMHSPVELVDLADVEQCAKLLAAFCLSLTAETRFERQ